MDTRTDAEVQAEYNRMNGIGAKDYGSKAVIKRDVLKWAKRQGYRLSRIHEMPKAQLKAIALKNNL
jgi:hypothetical protein